MTRLYFIHPLINDIGSFIRYTKTEGYLDPSCLVWDPDNPEILFSSEWIHYRKEYAMEFSRLYRKAAIKVAFIGEAIEPDWNLFDYAIGFSNMYSGNPRFIRILSPLDMFDAFVSEDRNAITSTDEARALLGQKTGFCNFLYSNPDAHRMRDELFYGISKYKRVDSLGKHLNNVGKLGTGCGGVHSAEGKNIKSAYKFSIASENAMFRGYTSEKVFSSMAAHTVPIYWGNPDIAEDVNPEAIINVADFGSMDALVAKIKEIDTDDGKWADIVAAPWRTDSQIVAQAERTAAYKDAMIGLLSGRKPAMVPEGYHIDLYRVFRLDGRYSFDGSFLYELKRKLKRLR